ncbi:MAG: ABC transporter substrate-binding protein [Prolixibacteraceae bacterium]|nr:ABC transporter substrate-binding protein [Prolixibacteraceae bacterium]
MLKIKMKHIFLIALFSGLLFFSCTQTEKEIKIGYVQINEDEVLNVAKEALIKILADSGYVDGENIKLVDNNAQGDLSMVTTILQSFNARGVDMVITNSTPCMAGAAQMVRDAPVVFTVAFGPRQIGMKNAPLNLYGYYDPLHCEEIIGLIEECVPHIKRVGLPYNNAEPNAEFAAKTFIAEFEKRGIEVVTATVNSSNDISMVGQYLAGKNIDAMLVTGDNTVYKGLNLLSKIAGESKIPLFVTDPLQSKKGAAVGFGINYERWGQLSGTKAVNLLKGRTVPNKIEPVEGLELIINTEACEQQGLVLPQGIVDKASCIL